MTLIENTFLPLVLGYLLGSIPFGLLITRLAGAGDIRSIGSGNIGATNVLRTGRKGLAALTLLADAMKGAVAVWIFQNSGNDIAVIAGLGALVGHVFPVWLGFKGGKGIAVYVGVLVALGLSGFLVFAVVWLVVAALFRYSSLAALVATVAVPLVLWVLGIQSNFSCGILALMTVLAWLMHRPNIQRLLSGTESKIGNKG
jgi:glycerol-3-phosphate acyltransferase PlsY